MAMLTCPAIVQTTGQQGRRLLDTANPPDDVLLLLPPPRTESVYPSLYGSSLTYTITPSASEAQCRRTFSGLATTFAFVRLMDGFALAHDGWLHIARHLHGGCLMHVLSGDFPLPHSVGV